MSEDELINGFEAPDGWGARGACAKELQGGLRHGGSASTGCSRADAREGADWQQGRRSTRSRRIKA